MQEWVIQIPSIPILVSVLFPSLHLKYFRIKFLLLVFFSMYNNYYFCVFIFVSSYVCYVCEFIRVFVCEFIHVFMLLCKFIRVFMFVSS